MSEERKAMCRSWLRASAARNFSDRRNRWFNRELRSVSGHALHREQRLSECAVSTKGCLPSRRLPEPLSGPGPRPGRASRMRLGRPQSGQLGRDGVNALAGKRFKRPSALPIHKNVALNNDSSNSSRFERLLSSGMNIETTKSLPLSPSPSSCRLSTYSVSAPRFHFQLISSSSCSCRDVQIWHLNTNSPWSQWRGDRLLSRGRRRCAAEIAKCMCSVALWSE